MNRTLIWFCCLSLILSLNFSCNKIFKTNKNEKFTVVTTTSLVSDLVKNIGKDSIVVKGLMGAGVDPHLYKASEGDVGKFNQADAIFYGGLHLEGKMESVFEKMNHFGKNSFAVSNGIPKDQLIATTNFGANYDPHIWFSIPNWKNCAIYVASQLSELKPDSKIYFEQNLNNYLQQLNELESQMNQKVAQLPIEKRILVTAHDAFSYFGREFDFQVVGLQGLSTNSEAGTRDLLNLVDFIVENKVKAVFVESSVPQRTILALQKAVENKGFKVNLGGTLYSDALGESGTPSGTYIGMYTENMNTIINALKL